VLPLPAGPPAPYKLTPYDLGEDFLADGPWMGGWMVFADGCETMSIDGQRNGRPLLYARDEVEARRVFYYILWPNLIVSVHPDYVLTHQAWPDGPNRSTVHCDLYVEAADLGTVDVSGAVEFWDITNIATALVVGLTAIAPVLGPHASGLVATFPVYVAVMAVFTQRHQGPAAAVEVLRGLLAGLFGTAAFYVVVHLAIVPAGIAAAFLLATAITLGIQAIALRRVRAMSPGPIEPEPA